MPRPFWRQLMSPDFIRLLQCASKFGDELNIHANKDLVSVQQPYITP